MPPKRKNKADDAEGSRPKKILRSGLRSRGKGKEKSALHEADAEELDEAPTVPDDIPDDRSETKKSRMSVRHLKFEAEILIPQRIKITEPDERQRDPFRHFGTDPPSVNYATVKGLEASQVWLSLDDHSADEIVEEYEVMENRGDSEAEYASFAMEMFFKRQRRFVQVPSDRKWRAERKISFVCPANPDRWVAPPSFETDGPEFKFDVRPDCSYWLSVAGFNKGYRGELVGAVYVHKGVITCPYFTIEFKKHGHSTEQPRVQACAAAAVALYNRFLLKKEALNVTESPWTDADNNLMRHYVITFVGSQFAIWILRANVNEDDGSWNGCTMSLLYEAMCTSSLIVRLLEKWINEIHRWGLSEHATSCERDSKIILGNGGVDVSMLDLEETGEQGPGETGEAKFRGTWAASHGTSMA